MARKIHPIAPAPVAKLAKTYAEAREAFELAESLKKQASQALLQALQDAELESAQTPHGVASVVASRRTVKVTCKALQAELDLLRERAVRTGRAVESFSAPYAKLA